MLVTSEDGRDGNIFPVAAWGIRHGTHPAIAVATAPAMICRGCLLAKKRQAKAA